MQTVGMTKKELWLNIKNYHFNNLVPPILWQNISQVFDGEDASTKAFATKISRKLKWKYRFARRAIWEYKKFVYLGIVSDFQVTPSRIIDQVWHEHVLFSKAYREFCTDVIQYPFDHNPELIPDPNITGIFHAQYLDTIELYKKEFGIDPPAAFWGTPKFGWDVSLPNPFISKKKNWILETANTGYAYDDTPLVAYFTYDMIGSESSFTEFNGGDFGGGGAGESWDGSDSGSDSSGSDGSSSCSSCSSGCGGGGD
jgi:hypothetical protein